MYGIQTPFRRLRQYNPFENDVKMYGIQTGGYGLVQWTPFENDVKMYGIQTVFICCVCHWCLRMM